MSRGLLIVDIQRDYFPGGEHPLVEPEAAAEAASRVLASFREAGDPVVHLKHVWDEPEATYLRPEPTASRSTRPSSRRTARR